MDYKNFCDRIVPDRGFQVPNQLYLKKKEPGVFFGYADESEHDMYVGMPQGTDGNIIIIGGNGSGKSSGIIKPTLETWQGAICATDIKGELTEHYKRMYECALQNEIEMRPFIVFDPMEPEGLSYDPFWWISQDDTANLTANIMDVVCTIIPESPRDNQPFWIQSEQAALAAGLLYYYRLGLSFSESVCELLSIGLPALCKDIKANGNYLENTFLGSLAEMKEETISCIDRGLRNKLIHFAADPYISHAFRGEREGARCFNWGDLEEANIFLHIPPDKVEHWGYAINLMYAQLIRYLERRPEQYSSEGHNNTQMLLMMDEFPRFGKLEMIVDAIPMLRSKNVNICLAVQSVAQLDRLYDEHGRRILFDNCQYQVILRANDAETQDLLCQLIGTTNVLQESVSKSMDKSGKKIGYTKQRAEGREPRLFPHELSTLSDVLVLSPYGVSRVQKRQPTNSLMEESVSEKHTNYLAYSLKERSVCMLTMDERVQNAEKHIEDSKHRQRLAERAERDRKKKEDSRRKYIIGDLVLKYFPELREIELDTNRAKTQENFSQVDAVLSLLASKRELISELRDTVKSGLHNVSESDNV